MKIILSIEPIKYPITGIGRYTLALAQHLPLDSRIDQIQYHENGRVHQNTPFPPVAPPSALSRSAQSGLRLLARNPILLEGYRAVRNLSGRRKQVGPKGAVFHGPNYYLPPVDCPTVATFHDLSVLTMPQCHPPERVRFMEKELAVSLERATFIITDSDYVRGEMISKISWPADRVRTVYLAGTSSVSDKQTEEVSLALDAFGLQPQSYSLFAGTIEPRKNLERLIIAYGKLSWSLRSRFPLVLAGHDGWNNASIKSRMEKAQQEGWLRYLGYVSDANLSHLMTGARLFVFPSLYEGFGLPVVEAMSRGVPVVCSDSSSLPEVAGDAAAMCDPQDIDAMSAHILRGLEDDDWQRAAIERGRAQASRFSWSRCAGETVSVYEMAARLC